MPPEQLNRFQRSLQRVDATRARMESLYGKSEINEGDMDSVYEALFLRAVTSFESFLEELFLAILQGRVQYARGRNVKLRMTVTSRDALMGILLQRQKYLTWLPFKDTIERAELYLVGGRPFTEWDNADRSMLRTIGTIRNAIAHRSSHAMNEFSKHVIASQALLPRERKPAGFLRSEVHGGRKRFQIYVGQLSSVAGTVC